MSNIKQKVALLVNHNKVRQAKSWWQMLRGHVDRMQNPTYLEVQPNFNIYGVPAEYWWDDWSINSLETPFTNEMVEIYDQANIAISPKRHYTYMPLCFNQMQTHMINVYQKKFMRQRLIIFIMSILLVIASIGIHSGKTALNTYLDKRDKAQIEELSKTNNAEAQEKILSLKEGIASRHARDENIQDELKKDIMTQKMNALNERAMKGEDVTAERDALMKDAESANDQSVIKNVIGGMAKQMIGAQ